MRVGVGFGHPAMGCPAGVGDPSLRTVAGLECYPGIEFGDTPNGADPTQTRSVLQINECQTG